MLVRLVSDARHSHILYTLSFPTNLLNLPIPPAWSNQLHLLTSVLHFESPHNIHVFDRSVGLVARIHDLAFDVPAKEVTVSFVDGRGLKFPMTAQCIQMLQSVVDDVQTCSEQEALGDNLEDTSVSVCSSVTSPQDVPSMSSVPPKSPKPGRHKRQRSLLFSLISSLIPRSMSPPPAPPPSPTTPTPTHPPPLPPIPPITPRNASLPPTPQSPITPYHPAFPTVTDPAILRCRARATLIDVWRQHVIPALSAHNHYAGHTEWVLRGFGTRVHSQARDIERSLQRCGGRGTARKHARTQSEGRAALDFGDRGCEEIQRRWCAPPPFPGEDQSEHDDCVVYPRNEQANQWNIRHVRNPSSGDDLDAYAFQFSEENDSLLRESFGFGADVYGDEWDDDNNVIFDDFGALDSRTEFDFDDGHFRFDEDLGSNYEGESYSADTTFAVTPFDAIEEDDSDDSQSSLRTPEDGIPLALPLQATLPGPSGNGACFQQRNHSDSVPAAVSKTTSSRPKARPLQSSYRAPKSPPKPMHSPYSPPRLPRRKPIPNMEEILSSRIVLLSQIRSALNLARIRAHEEHWGSVRSQDPFGSGLLDPESERLLETRARRRAWSAGIKVSAASASALTPAVVAAQGSSVWNGSIPSVTHFPHGPPGLAPPMRQANGPIIPAGLSLGRPVRRSPLGMYVWSADDVVRTGKFGALGLKRGGETAPKRPLRVSFLDSPTKLFPVREEGDDEQGSLDGNNSKIDFPQSPTSPTSPTSPGKMADERFCIGEGGASAFEDENQDDPFFCSPFQARTRTTSMYGGPSSQYAQLSQVLPMFAPRTPPPSYQTAVGEEEEDSEPLDACALLCQPLSTLRLSAPTPTRPPLVPNPSFTPRVRSLSLPTTQSGPLSQSPATNDEDCQDLSRAYAAPPPPATPITAPPAIALTESCLTYAHLHAPVPICGKGSVAKGMKGKGIASQEVVFERNGKEYTLGLEVALGRAEEGRSVW